MNLRLNDIRKRMWNGQLSRRQFLRQATALGGTTAFINLALATTPIGYARAQGGLAREYDYVVVGAGSAGCAIAMRLAEANIGSVLLVEAGSTDNLEAIHIPPAWPATWGTDNDWIYQTTPQAQTENRTHYWPSGKVLGGSSSINAMVFTRGTERDFDDWRDAGLDGWGWQDVLPFFKKLEDYAGGASELRGEGGPLHVSLPENLHPASRAFFDAALSAGYNSIQDINAGRIEGVALSQLAIKSGRRQSSATAYLHPETENLSVVTEAVVKKLNIVDGRCDGVTLLDGQSEVSVAARNEVILSAGAIQSPHVLMQSGIGPADHLSEHGIDVLVELPGVGENLHDHPVVGGVVATYAGDLPVSEYNHAEAVVFSESSLAQGRPDLGLIMITAPYVVPHLTQPENPAITIMPAAMRPKSRGTLRLSSSDPLSRPLIDPGYLTNAEDLNTLVEAVMRARELFASSDFAPFIAGEFLPGAAVKSRTELEDFVRSALDSFHHYVGTCRMGSGADAVVGSDLRVRGVEKLRIADASVIPTIPSVAINAAVTMIGEKAAGMVISEG